MSDPAPAIDAPPVPIDGGRPPAEDARRRPAATPLAVWAVLLGGLAGVQAGFGGDLLPVLVQGAAAATMAVIALAIRLAPSRRRPAGLRTVPELSTSSALAALSLAAIVSGASVGTWLIIGGSLGLALAIGGLVRERRAERRARVAAALVLSLQDRPSTETAR